MNNSQTKLDQPVQKAKIRLKKPKQNEHIP